jgi:sulfate permease, SulP family
LPEVVLAAIVLVAVSTLVSVRQAKHAWQVERTDGIALLVTFAATLLLGVELGIGIGIAASLVLSLWRVGVPRLRVRSEPEALVIHVDGDLLPASGVRLLETVEEHLDDGPIPGRHLVLDLAGVPSADLSGIEAIGAIDIACRAADVELQLVGVRAGVLSPLARDGVVARRLHGRVTVRPRNRVRSRPRTDPVAGVAPSARAPV